MWIVITFEEDADTSLKKASSSIIRYMKNPTLVVTIGWAFGASSGWLAGWAFGSDLAPFGVDAGWIPSDSVHGFILAFAMLGLVGGLSTSASITALALTGVLPTLQWGRVIQISLGWILLPGLLLTTSACVMLVTFLTGG